MYFASRDSPSVLRNIEILCQIVLSDKSNLPDLGHQLFLGQDLARVLDEQHERIESLRRERQNTIAIAERSLLRIENELSEREPHL